MDTDLMFSVLRKAGFSETHSEAITSVMRERGRSCEFASKNDLQDIRYEYEVSGASPNKKGRGYCYRYSHGHDVC